MNEPYTSTLAYLADYFALLALRLHRQVALTRLMRGESQNDAFLGLFLSEDEIGTILKSAAGENTLFDLEIGGTRRKVILKEFQREPLRGKLLHADFYEVALDKKLEVKVHIELQGTPVGVKLEGGIVDFVTRELEIECLPADIPEKVLVDISHLDLGKRLRVSDLKLSAKIELLTDPGG